MYASKANNVCFSGGVAHNCKMIGEIIKNLNLKNCFVIPAASDSGAAIGAAVLAGGPCNSMLIMKAIIVMVKNST